MHCLFSCMKKPKNNIQEEIIQTLSKLSPIYVVDSKNQMDDQVIQTKNEPDIRNEKYINPDSHTVISDNMKLK